MLRLTNLLPLLRRGLGRGFTALLICFTQVVLAQTPAPGKTQSKSVLLLNGTAHLGTGKVIKNSAIGFTNGKITLVKDLSIATVDKTQFDTVITIYGKHVYPGFIAPNSTLGLQEIEAVRATNDQREIGKFNPHIRSIIAYNTESEVTATVRTNGVLMGQITPRGGRISGSSSIVTFDAWNWEDAVIKIDEGIHVNWPAMYANTGWWAEPGEIKKNNNYTKQVEELKQYLLAAKAYAEVKTPEEKDLRFEAMKGIFDDSKTTYIHVNSAKAILQMANLTKLLGISKVVIVGGQETYLVTDILKEREIAVMIERTHSLPNNSSAAIDLPYKLPALLQEAGVLYCLENAGDMEQMNARNLPFLAGTAAAYGLTKEQALKAITLNTAKIIGIDNLVGSLEVGKQATLFISTGDALDMTSNKLENAWVQGRLISLRNHQTDLYEKYEGKYSN